MFALGMAVLSEPLYKMFCASVGIVDQQKNLTRYSDQVEQMKRVKNRRLRVNFTADKHALMQWQFKPQQTSVDLVPGETALVFYRAKNPIDKHVIGVSTYTISPFEAGQYFNKIQCFCFEQQMLGPNEEVDLPVFFYIDPEFDRDPILSSCRDITLNYTFFEVNEQDMPSLPGFPNNNLVQIPAS